MFYKKQKLGGKWYPRSFTVNTVDTKEVARRLSLMSTVTVGDTYAVLLGLGEVLGELMSAGNSVKLDGLGTFYLVGNANGAGVETPEEVSPKQFKKMTVRGAREPRPFRRHDRSCGLTHTFVKGDTYVRAQKGITVNFGFHCSILENGLKYTVFLSERKIGFIRRKFHFSSKDNSFSFGQNFSFT